LVDNKQMHSVLITVAVALTGNNASSFEHDQLK